MEDILIYVLHCPLTYYFPFELDSGEKGIFLNQKMFPKMWEETNLDKVNSLFFEEGLYRSIKISEGFLLLCHSLKKIDKSLILNEIIKKTNFSKTDSDKISTYFNNNYEKKPFETLIYIYTMESNFYRFLNRALTQNIDISYENFLKSMFFHKALLEKTYVVTSPIVYRSVALKKQNPNDLSNMR